MSPLAQRILSQGGLAAVLLGAIGFLLALFASMMIADTEVPVPRGAAVKKEGGEPGKEVVPAPQPASDEFELPMLVRVPLTLATLGFVFVAVTELGLHFIRQGQPPKSKIAAAAEPGSPEHTAKLLEEILRQAEAKQREEAAQKAEGGKATPEAAAGSPTPEAKKPEAETQPPPSPTT